MVANLPLLPALLLQAPSAVASGGGGALLPAGATTGAERTDQTFLLLLGVSIALLLYVAAKLLLPLVRRRAAPAPAGRFTTCLLETAYVAVPLLLVGPLFVAGLHDYVDAAVPPAGAFAIQATASGSGFQFSYPTGFQSDELHVPADRPVALTLEAGSGPATLAIPAFRLKSTALPGAGATTWFQATAAGVYASFGGATGRPGRVEVHPAAAFDTWLQMKSDPYKGLAPEAAGEVAYRLRACVACHSIDGSPLVGPSWFGLFGSARKTDKGEVVADEAYLKEAILEPNAKVVEGFPPAMPPTPLTDDEVTYLIAYIKSLKTD